MTAGHVTPPHLAAGLPAGEGDLLLRRRLRLVEPWLCDSGGTLLDFGCGNGAQTLLFARRFAHVVGVDIDSAFLRRFHAAAAQLGLAGRVSGVRGDGAVLPCREASVDCLMSFEVLEHVADEAKALREMWRVLRPGGLLAISVPNRWWVFETHGATLPFLRWNRVPFFSWLPKRLHDRWAKARIYRRREIVTLLRAAGFEIHGQIYVTAPMDVVRSPRLQSLLRRTLFRSDATRLPFLATACLILARRTNGV